MESLLTVAAETGKEEEEKKKKGGEGGQPKSKETERDPEQRITREKGWNARSGKPWICRPAAVSRLPLPCAMLAGRSVEPPVQPVRHEQQYSYGCVPHNHVGMQDRIFEEGGQVKGSHRHQQQGPAPPPPNTL